MTITEWLSGARAQLAESGCPDPEIDARWMAEDALDMTHTELTFEGSRALPPEQQQRLDAMLSRRLDGVPVQYVLNSADFMGLRFYVDERVLIPRQDTETLVEAALIAVRQASDPSVLDLCAGSGCIGLSLKTLAPDAEVVLTDISRDALDVARANAKALNVEADFKHGDLFKAVGRARFDLILSNPPYIPHGDMAGLQREVHYEPALALDGGPDGLDLYRRIAADAAAHLNDGGAIYLEVGIGQAEAVQALLHSGLPGAQTGIIKDLNGIDRVVWAKLD